MRSKFFLSGTTFIILMLVYSCEPYDPKKDYQWKTPFPDNEMAAIIQETVDSDSTVLFWTEPEDVVQAYVNRTPFAALSTRNDVRMLSRTMMHMTAELILKDDNLKLQFELKRAFPEKGLRSILQVINVRAEKWPVRSE